MEELNDTDLMLKKVSYRNALKAMTLGKRYPGSLRYEIQGEIYDLKTETMRLMEMMRNNATKYI